MSRRMPYVICDTNGEPVTAEWAKQLIAQHWTIPPDVRSRRRSRKPKRVGKVPQQVHKGQARSDAQGADERGDLPRPRSSTDRPARSRPMPRAAELTATPG
jgi:hypothetical protein